MELNDVMYLTAFLFFIIFMVAYIAHTEASSKEKRLITEKRKKESGRKDEDPEELDAEILELKKRKEELEKKNIEGKKLEIEKLKNEISTLERKTQDGP